MRTCLVPFIISYHIMLYILGFLFLRLGRPLTMAALQPSVSALASRSGTDLAKPSWPRGNIYAETQEAM